MSSEVVGRIEEPNYVILTKRNIMNIFFFFCSPLLQKIALSILVLLKSIAYSADSFTLSYLINVDGKL